MKKAVIHPNTNYTQRCLAKKSMFVKVSIKVVATSDSNPVTIHIMSINFTWKFWLAYLAEHKRYNILRWSSFYQQVFHRSEALLTNSHSENQQFQSESYNHNVYILGSLFELLLCIGFLRSNLF